MNIICSKCGGTNVTCEAIINPNTKKLDHYTDKSFLNGWCNDCRTGTILTDVDEIKNDMKDKYLEFRKTMGIEPQYADCRIVWKDDQESYDVRIMLSADTCPEEDKNVFYHCNSPAALSSLAEYGNEDFIVTECYGFALLTEMEILGWQTFEYEVEGKAVSVTGKEVLDLYGKHYELKKEDVERYAARNACRIKYYREGDAPLLDHSLMKKLLDEEKLMEKGETRSFKLQLFFLWHVTILKEDDSRYEPFKYIVDALCLDNIQAFGRRYVTLEAALLHCLNEFNENARMLNRYRSTSEYISTQRRKGGEL